eukprot:CAMPEP_0181269448 /NCGR_PEP_ID=MMETSP1097-20121128/6146_1 /TAXON_ID=35684 /ORGANISM="Pseudopedinella elastica, Strain CCMP716" /LENGTH=439 /DNA_ID=CAMNT_0023369357 /DNA_START=285 /DNA_END=1601 /DNA_ORIENTATION=+
MKKVFKASLLASAMAFTMGTQAATVSSPAFFLSTEGVAQGLEAVGEDLQIDVAVSVTHPSASTITLTFDSNVDLTGVAAAAGGTVTQSAGNGTGTSGDIVFSYGTGSFTFDNVVIDTTTAPTAQTITFQVNLGNPLTADSAFRININGSDTDISGASTLSYSSKTAADVAIETGTGTIASLKSQFSYAVTNGFDKRIERLNRLTFTDAVPTNTTDVLNWTLSNDGTLGAALAGVSATFLLEGDMENIVAGELTLGGMVGAVPAAAADEDEFLFSATAGEVGAVGAATPFSATFVSAAGEIVTADFTLTATLTSTSPGTTPITLTAADAGEWLLDASIVNVPYLPVGYGLSPNVEIANDGSTDASIQLEAFDQNGVEYGPVTLTAVAKKKTVTKVSEADLKTAFGLSATDKKKLSVTFILDADADDITLAPYYREGISRV